MRKPRILFVNEWHRLNSGYGTMGAELLSRFHKSGKYEIFELAQYADKFDPRVAESPWPVFCNLPAGYNQRKCDENELNAYQSSAFNEFGAWRFEQACLESQCDIVVNWEDFWYMSYQNTSPYRKLFSWIIQPACDSAPQNEQWIATFKDAERILLYTDWGVDVMTEEGGGLMNVVGAASPGVDLDVFKPILNRSSHKQKYGFDPNSLIIGFQNRNQKRKLIPDLIEAFAGFNRDAPKDLADRSILYLGTSFPDIGWKISRLIKKSGVSHKIFFTYLCSRCNLVIPQTFRDAVTICPRCKDYGMRMPNTHMGLSRPQLAEIYNLFDVFVQYANSEGIGMAGPESASCGCPYFGVDYSGMSDVVKKLEGTPIKVLKLLTESETGCCRAVPDDNDFVQKLIKFLSLPESIRNQKRIKTRQLAIKHYNWDDTAAKWMNVFDSISIEEKNQWLSPPLIHTPPNSYPDRNHIPDDKFIDWAIVNVLGRPDMIGSYFSLRLLRDLLMGSTETQIGSHYSDMSTLGMRPQYRQFGRQEVVDELMRMVEFSNKWESKREELIRNGFIR